MDPSNPYSTPEAELALPGLNKESFYVVSTRKFTLLYFLTLGLYELYWFYKQWNVYRQHTGMKLWPVPRAIFSIFFTHSLFNKINDRIDAQELNYDWAPRMLATIFVVISVISALIDRLTMMAVGEPWLDLIGLTFLLLIWFPLVIAQKAANLASGDQFGDSNSTLTTANYIWMGLGSLLWLSVLAGLLVIFGLMPVS